MNYEIYTDTGKTTFFAISLFCTMIRVTFTLFFTPKNLKSFDKTRTFSEWYKPNLNQLYREVWRNLTPNKLFLKILRKFTLPYPQKQVVNLTFANINRNKINLNITKFKNNKCFKSPNLVYLTPNLNFFFFKQF